jgi:hypothetical protein
MEQLVVQDYVLQYGVLGLVAFILTYFAWSQYKRLVKKNDDLELKVDKLQEEMVTHLVEERDKLAQLIRDNTEALTSLQRTIVEFMINRR